MHGKVLSPVWGLCLGQAAAGRSWRGPAPLRQLEAAVAGLATVVALCLRGSRRSVRDSQRGCCGC